MPAGDLPPPPGQQVACVKNTTRAWRKAGAPWQGDLF